MGLERIQTDGRHLLLVFIQQFHIFRNGTRWIQPKLLMSFVQVFSALLRSCNPTINIMGSDGEGRKPTAS
jgi:hypothetical protein